MLRSPRRIVRRTRPNAKIPEVRCNLFSSMTMTSSNSTSNYYRLVTRATIKSSRAQPPWHRTTWVSVMIVMIQLELRCRAPIHNATSLYLPSLRKEEVDDNYPGFDGITFHFLGSILDVATPNDLSSQHQPPLPQTWNHCRCLRYHNISALVSE
jgi:hypothetical protein